MAAKTFTCVICQAEVSKPQSYAYKNGRACRNHPEVQEVHASSEQAKKEDLEQSKQRAERPAWNFNRNQPEMTRDEMFTAMGLKDPNKHCWCCHIFALALAELTNLKIAAFLEKRAVFINEDGTKSSIPMYYYNPATKHREYDEIGEGLVHAVCLIDDKSELIFDANGIRHVDNINDEFEIREDTYLKILDNPNEILVYGHTFGERNKDVNDYVSLTKDYIHTYLKDELKQLKG